MLYPAYHKSSQFIRLAFAAEIIRKNFHETAIAFAFLIMGHQVGRYS